MLTRRATLSIIVSLVAGAATSIGASAQTPAKISALATFSILGDIVRNVGGDRVEVSTLVGPDGDAHVYAPTPADARRLSEAKIVFTNGLKFEGWIDRLVKSSGTRAPTIEAARGVRPLKSEDDHGACSRRHGPACLAERRQRQALRGGNIATG